MALVFWKKFKEFKFTRHQFLNLNFCNFVWSALIITVVNTGSVFLSFHDNNSLMFICAEVTRFMVSQDNWMPWGLFTSVNWLICYNHWHILTHLFPNHPFSTFSVDIHNSFSNNVPLLFPLKTSENRTVFWCFQRVEKGCIGNKWVKAYYVLSWSCQIQNLFLLYARVSQF